MDLKFRLSGRSLKKDLYNNVRSYIARLVIISAKIINN